MRILLLLLLLSTFACVTGPKTRTTILNVQPALQVEEIGPSPSTEKTVDALKRLLATRDLSIFTFRKKIRIKDNPGLEPQLTPTLAAVEADNPERLLAAYLQAQMEAYLLERPRKAREVVRMFKEHYAATAEADGITLWDQKALHVKMAAAWLGFQALKHLVGETKAAQSVRVSGGPPEDWIYKTITQDDKAIGVILDSQGLIPPPLKPPALRVL